MVDDPIGDPPSAVSAWNIANALTVLRLALVPVFVVALFAHGGHDNGWRIAAWAVFAVASVTDRIDGDIARKRHIVTEFGKLADPIADKALIGAALIGLSVLRRPALVDHDRRADPRARRHRCCGSGSSGTASSRPAAAASSRRCCRPWRSGCTSCR